MSVQWFVFSLSGSKANRSNDNNVWGLLKSSCRDCFERLKFLKIDVSRPVFSLSKNKANRSNWWFTKISKRFLMNVQWFVFPLNKNRTNRSNDDDIWKLLKFPCRDCFKKLKFFEINVSQFVFSLSENKTTNQINDSQRFQKDF